MRVVALISGCLILAGFVVWQVAFPTYSYRYRLTVSVAIGDEVHTGSSVIEVTWREHQDFGNGRFLPGVRGQAVVVDLGTRGAVVAVLYAGESPVSSKSGPWDATWIAARAFGNGSTDSELPELPRLTGQRELAADNMPRFVWFGNLNDPASARPVLPEEIGTWLGASVHLRAYVEITRDAIVIDIDKKLPWYRALAERQEKQGIVGRPHKFDLFYSMFIGGQTFSKRLTLNPCPKAKTIKAKISTTANIPIH